MKRILIVFCALGLVALLAMPVLAEVQNIKVSGSIDIKGINRASYTTMGSGGGRTLTGFQEGIGDQWYYMCTKLGVDADLTDNVMANILLANEQDWASGGSQAVNLYVAAITMKEMLYSPLTIKAGKMPLQVADGLMVGDGVVGETVMGSDLAAARSFYALAGILDYDPLTLIIATAKCNETAGPLTAGDDIDGYIVDAIYKMADYNAVLDTYLINMHYRSPDSPLTTGPDGTSTAALDIYALASRLTMEPAERLMLDLGIALQTGDYAKTALATRKLSAMAFNLGLMYAMDAEYSPKVGIKYIYRSGDDGDGTGDFKGWLACYENQVNGMIRDPNTNTSSIALSGSLVPMDKMTLALDLWMYQLAKKPAVATTANDTKKDDGMEIDIALKYAYTEDVTLGLSLAYFMPGDYWKAGYDETASQILAEVGVKF